MKLRSFTFLSLFALAALAGCSRGARLETPSGFATLEDDSQNQFSYRATSARGVVLATRTQPNDVKANTEFWADALDLRLKDKGYVAESTRTVKTAKGLSGTQIRYVTSRNGREHRYWLTVFATKSKVYVVEAAGDKEPFDKAAGTVDSAMSQGMRRADRFTVGRVAWVGWMRRALRWRARG